MRMDYVMNDGVNLDLVIIHLIAENENTRSFPEVVAVAVF